MSCCAMSWLLWHIGTGTWRTCVSEHVTKKVQLSIMYCVYEQITAKLINHANKFVRRYISAKHLPKTVKFGAVTCSPVL